MEWGAEGQFGLRNTEIDPAKPSGEALGLKNGNLEPGRALIRGCRGAIGIKNRKSDPAAAFCDAFGIEIANPDPAAEVAAAGAVASLQTLWPKWRKGNCCKPSSPCG